MNKDIREEIWRNAFNNLDENGDPIVQPRKIKSDGEVNRVTGIKRFYKQNPDQVRKGEKNPFFGKTHSEETKKRLSTNHKGLQAGEKNPMFGKKRPDELKEKLSKLYKGVKVGEKNPFFGKTHSEETKKILSEKRKLQPVTNELKPCYAIDPFGIRFDFKSLSECGISLNYPSFRNNAHQLLPNDGTLWKVQRGRFKGWSFGRIV